MTNPYETLKIDRPAKEIAVVTLNRPERFNAMTMTMFDELEAYPKELNKDDDLRAVILTGAGNYFCAGFDLQEIDEMFEMDVRAFLTFQEKAVASMMAMRTMRVPVIAAVNGAAAGGGFAIALHADIRLASPRAVFNAAYVKIGLSCGEMGTSWLLPRMVGISRSAEILYTARNVGAEEAERIGLVSHVYPQEALLNEAMAMAEVIAQNSPGGIQLSKRAMQAGLESASMAAAIEMENRGQTLLSRGSDFREGIAAVREKRAACYSGT
ncbi:MAG: enoyl-CoA hydratase/isomerase family protein [Pseudomonadales bacterium]|nr:enoyl-CoA hydratase/isomerase family protein [Pseudomonadales bacterium]